MKRKLHFSFALLFLLSLVCSCKKVQNVDIPNPLPYVDPFNLSSVSDKNELVEYYDTATISVVASGTGFSDPNVVGNLSIWCNQLVWYNGVEYQPKQYINLGRDTTATIKYVDLAYRRSPDSLAPSASSFTLTFVREIASEDGQTVATKDSVADVLYYIITSPIKVTELKGYFDRTYIFPSTVSNTNPAGAPSYLNVGDSVKNRIRVFYEEAAKNNGASGFFNIAYLGINSSPQPSIADANNLFIYVDSINGNIAFTGTNYPILQDLSSSANVPFLPNSTNFDTGDLVVTVKPKARYGYYYDAANALMQIPDLENRVQQFEYQYVVVDPVSRVRAIYTNGTTVVNTESVFGKVTLDTSRLGAGRTPVDSLNTFNGRYSVAIKSGVLSTTTVDSAYWYSYNNNTTPATQYRDILTSYNTGNPIVETNNIYYALSPNKSDTFSLYVDSIGMGMYSNYLNFVVKNNWGDTFTVKINPVNYIR
ncbi:MAG: hypothetical protein QM528_03470 [Phycisphaerales bacterium]|nr:hypothetical protein [Phycisphaerales bacterium]